MNDEIIQQSEPEFLVFISSRQSPEMVEARRQAYEVIDEFPLTRPWAFENMPASSEAAREHYLRYAYEADFVIWLVGRETTPAVVDEIHACMSVQGSLLAFLLPSNCRDIQTDQLINEVSGYVKWRPVESLGNLGANIRAALQDEIIRAVRNPNPPGRLPWLSRQREETIYRCKGSWTALGVPDDVAEELARDRSIGHELKKPAGEITMIVGDQGVGKTLALQRLYQNAIDQALKDSSKPFPIFANASAIIGSLSDYVERAAMNYAFPANQPTLILIDGLDEGGRDSANRLLDDAVPYVEANPNMTMAFSARSLPGTRVVGHRVEIPALDDEGILGLISKVAGRTVEMREIRAWSESVRDAAKRPLFSVMIGAELREGNHVPGTRPIDLVDRLADRVLNDAGDRRGDVDTLLQTLAVKAVDSGGGVHRSEVSPKRADQILLADTRLVSDEADMFDFTLPIFREWFAARALVEETFALKDILPLSERWVIPITVAVHSENKRVGELLMATLTRSDPGLAGLVLKESEDSRAWHTKEKHSLGTPEEVGIQVRRAMEDWAAGIGVLMQKTGPVTDDGSISTVGIEVESSWVTTAWYHGNEPMAKVVPIPDQNDPLSLTRDWPVIHSASVLPERVWPWAHTKQDLASSLSKELVSRRLALISDDAVRELAYSFGCAVKNQYWSTPNSVKIMDLLGFIDEHLGRGTVSLGIGYTVYDQEELLEIRRHLAELSEGGEEFISDPWPGPDKARPPGRNSWAAHETFTDEQLLERTQAIYAAALRIYADMIRKWFQAFDDRLRLMRIFPVKLMGRLTILHPEEGHVRPTFPPKEPILTWWPLALNSHEESQVAFELDPQTQSSREEVRLLIDSARKASYARTEAFYRVTTRLHVFGPRPATELAHRWLIEELGRLGWTDLLG